MTNRLQEVNVTEIENIIRYSQNLPDNTTLDCKRLLADWRKNKDKFIKMFDGALIAETEELVTVRLDPESRREKIDAFYENLSMMCYSYPDSFSVPKPYLFTFLERNEDGIFDNVVITPYECEGHNLKIPAGMKLTRALKFFISDKVVLDTVQTSMSRLIQQTKITGRLCLSVHPLDYLSVSENASNWRSCHALDGEYRAGNLAYMVDSNTIVTYLKSDDENVTLPNFPNSIKWNNKKWRMLLFLSDGEDAMFAGRHYPFFSKDLMDKTKTLYAILYDRQFRKQHSWYITPHIWTEWRNEEIHDYKYKGGGTIYFSTPYIPIRDRLTKKKTIINHSKSGTSEDLFYNDLLYSSCYTPYYAWRESPMSNEKLYFSIGSNPVYCPHCGFREITQHDRMLCDQCDEKLGDYVYCVECGERIARDCALYVDCAGGYICQSCYDESYFTCARCGEIRHNNDSFWDEELDEYLCPECYDERREPEEE